MSAIPPTTTTPDTTLLKEAADWVMDLRYGGPAERDAEAFERWRQQSPAHGEAWARAEAVMGSFAQLPAGIGKNALGSLQQQQRTRRRRSLQLLGALLVAAPAGWLAWRQAPWQEWSADVATATGERRTLQLADGTQLVLNTATAVDIAFTATERRVHLRAGEILVTTGHADPSPTHRPFTVQTAQGSVQALGTRFSVRQLDGAQGTSRVAVFEQAVQVHTDSGATRTLRAGEQADFTATAVQAAVPVDASAALWEQGMLLARGMRLADVLAEMARHRSGVLRCHPAVADLQVSGAIALGDTDMALALLERSLPVRVERLTKYWVTVGPQ